MRPVLVSDLITAARAVLASKPTLRTELALQLIKEADFADRYTRRFGRPHAVFGDGTLSSAARKQPLADEPTLDNTSFCECVELVVRQLIARRVTVVRR